MNHLVDVPLWAAIPIALLTLGGALLTLIGAIGLVKLPSFYDRLHAPSLATSFGTGGIVLASVLLFSSGGGRFALHEVLVWVFITVTTPVTVMFLARTAHERDRAEAKSKAAGEAFAEDD